MKKSLFKFHWKRDKRAPGLGGITAGPPHSSLFLNKTTLCAMVSPSYNRETGINRWYWVAGWDTEVPHKNTCRKTVETLEQAQADACAYVTAELAPLALGNLPLEKKKPE